MTELQAAEYKHDLERVTEELRVAKRQLLDEKKAKRKLKDSLRTEERPSIISISRGQPYVDPIE